MDAMLIVCSLNQAQAAYRAHGPGRVISILSEDECVPTFPHLADDHHLRLYVERDASASTISNAAKLRAEKVIEFINAWDKNGHILVHCNRGVSRSMGAAFIVLCMMRVDDDETSLAAMLRRIAPHCDPCPLIVAHADDALMREGRMIDAVEDLEPPCTDLAAPVLTVPLAA